MKKKIIAFLLIGIMIVNTSPVSLAAPASANITDGFLKEVTLPLPQAISSGLMDEPDFTLPAADGSDFIASIEGWMPRPVHDGLPAAAKAPATDAIAISTPEELQAMTAGSYVLTADIDLTEYLSTQAWMPISANGSVTLDGQGHTIRGFSLSGIVSAHIGLFSDVRGTLSVKNLRWEDASVVLDQGSGLSYNVGTLAGRIEGLELQNFVTSNVAITRGDVSSGYLGGLVGVVYGTVTAFDCCLEASLRRDTTLTGTEEKASGLGGLAGYVRDEVTATNCYIRSEIIAPDASDAKVGGLVSYLTGKTCRLRDIWVAGSLSASSGWCGGLVGYHTTTTSSFTAENCLSTLSISGQDCMGGLLGYSDYPIVTFTDCRYTGGMTLAKGSIACAGGLIGKAQNGQLMIENCASNITVCTAASDMENAPGITYVGGLAGNCNNNDYRINRCTAAVSVDAPNIVSAKIGGMIGYEQGTRIHYLQDCIAQLNIPTMIASSGLAVGGLIGFSVQTTLVNCGANVNVALISTARSADHIGGLVGNTANGVQMSRCYSAGSIGYTYAVANEAVSPYLGGLAGGGSNAKNSIGQCYGGTDIRISIPDGTFRGYVGGLLGAGNQTTIYSCWSNASFSVQAEPGDNSAVGGLVGFTNGTMMDSCFTGTTSCAAGSYLGGLVGRGSLYLRNCYAETDLSGGNRTAGLIGGRGGGSTSIYDCRYRGDIQNEGVTNLAAGLITELGAGDEIGRCRAEADIKCVNGIAGGAVASSSTEITIRDCEFTGRVAGYRAGGITGTTPGANLFNCTVEGVVEVADTRDSYNIIGGVAAYAQRLENCHMLSPITISTGADAGCFGGVLGVASEYGSTLINCTSRGISVSTACNLYNRTNIGGIAGGDIGASTFGMENCRVMGAVYGKAAKATLHVGGIAGVGGGDYNNCSVTGNVTGVVEDPSDTYGTLCAGGIIGSSVLADLFACYHAGSVSVSAPGENKAVHTDDPLVGYGVFGIDGTPPSSSARKEETYTFCTYYYEDGKPYDLFPLAGADIAVNGQPLGTTDASGMLTLSNEDLTESDLVTLVAEKDGYFAAERTTWLADGGTYSLYLGHKIPGKIYLRSATLLMNEGEPKELLYNRNKYELPQLDDTYHILDVTVDWNDTQEDSRSLFLTNEDGSTKEAIANNGSTAVLLTGIFEPNEDLYLQADGLDSEGNPVTAKQKLSLRITPIPISLNTPSADADFGGDEGVYLLSGLGIKFALGDLIKFGPEVTMENGVLKINFDLSAEESTETVIGLFNDNKTSIGITGKLEVPVAKGAQGGWIGQLGVMLGGELGEEDDSESLATKHPLLEHKYQTWLGSIPILFSTKIGAKAAATVGFEGSWTDPGYLGELNGEGDMVVAVGPGLAYGDDLEVSVTGNGNIKLAFPIQYHYNNLDGGFSFNPSLEGFVSAVATLKAYDLFGEEGLTGEIKLGGFKWDLEDGVDWYSVVDDASPVSRAYLAKGSGFVDSEMALLDWSDSETNGSRLLYQNVLSDSHGAMALENGNAVLYFTADDGAEGTAGDACQHTALYKTVQQSDGAWSAPICLSGSENGYPAIPHADDSFVVWINSTDRSSLDSLLCSTDLHVLLPDDSLYTIEGQGDYLYDAKVAAKDGKALVTWLQAEPTILPKKPTLHYAYFNGSVWGIGEVNTQGYTVTGAAPDWSGSISRICWQTDTGLLMSSTGSTYASHTVLLSGTVKNAVSGAVSASMAVDGTLAIRKGDSLLTALPTGGDSLSQLLVLSDDSGAQCVVWTETNGIYYVDSASEWKYAKLLCPINGRATRLSGIMVDGQPRISYYLSDSRGALHLFAALPETLDGVDLSLYDIAADDTDLSSTGLLALSGTIGNLREDPAAGYLCTVTDEEGTVYYSGSAVSAALEYGDRRNIRVSFVPDLTIAHTYTMTVLPTDENGETLTDVDLSNNTCSITPASAPEIVSAGFYPASGGGTRMEIYVKNNGAAPTDTVTVSVYPLDQTGIAADDALFSRSYTEIPCDSYRQILLDTIVPNTYYKVTLCSGEEVLDSTLLMLEDETASGVWLNGIQQKSGTSASVMLESHNWQEPALICMALYECDTDRMVWSNLQRVVLPDGIQSIPMEYSQELAAGTYRCRVFLLTEERLEPICKQIIGTVRIS